MMLCLRVWKDAVREKHFTSVWCRKGKKHVRKVTASLLRIITMP